MLTEGRGFALFNRLEVWAAFSFVGDGIFALDMVLNMFVFAFEDKGLVVSSAAKIRDNYRSGNFCLDVVSWSVYLDLATAVVGLEFLAILRIPRWFPF